MRQFDPIAKTRITANSEFALIAKPLISATIDKKKRVPTFTNSKFLNRQRALHDVLAPCIPNHNFIQMILP